jgi:hypothetical protein
VNRRLTFQLNAEQLNEGIVVPSRGNFNLRLRQDDEEEEEAVDAGEEFTPEEQLELVRENARAGKTDILLAHDGQQGYGHSGGHVWHASPHSRGRVWRNMAARED